ncbi:MAG TPA: FtsQ-type POTRA domain-containing protein [Polyangiaceae bacterium]|nr:FtsQ-type POTRA domain-containing protein [Polyangiaceae bacterium]
MKGDIASARRAQRHGAQVSAPEEVFAVGESPLPGPVEAKALDGSRAPRGRTGRALQALKVGLGALLVVGTSLGVAFSARRYALTSDRFAIQHISVTGGRRFDAARIRQVGKMPPGQNLFALDTQVVEARLLDDPWVASAKVVRRLPSTLEVTITEREAKALALLGDRLYLVTPNAEPFKQVEGEDPVDLPVITGLSPESLLRDRPRALERLALGLELLAQYQELNLSRAYVAEEVHLDESGTVTLIVGKDGIVLNLGRPPYRPRLLMAERVVEEARRSGHLPGIVFADNEAHPERVVVRMR